MQKEYGNDRLFKMACGSKYYVIGYADVCMLDNSFDLSQYEEREMMKKIIFILSILILFLSCDKYIFNGKIHSKQFYPAVWETVPSHFEMENKYNWMEDEWQLVNVWYEEHEEMVFPDRWCFYLRCGENIIEESVSAVEFSNYNIGDYYKIVYDWYIPKEVEKCVDIVKNKKKGKGGQF